MKKIWKFSRIRFYILNTIWNYKFWMYAIPIYKTFNYEIIGGIDELSSDVFNPTNFNSRLKFKKEQKSYQKFIGFSFEGGIYQDNPGLKWIDQETRDNWIKKKLIK